MLRDLLLRLLAGNGNNGQGPLYTKKTMIFVVDPQGCWWHMGQSGKRRIMQVACLFDIINLTHDLEVLPIVAMLRRSKTYGHVSIKDLKSDNWGGYRIPPKGITEARMDFWVPEVICKEGDIFKSDIIIFDQFNNKHVVRNVVFKYRKR